MKLRSVVSRVCRVPITLNNPRRFLPMKLSHHFSLAGTRHFGLGSLAVRPCISGGSILGPDRGSPRVLAQLNPPNPRLVSLQTPSPGPAKPLTANGGFGGFALLGESWSKSRKRPYDTYFFSERSEEKRGRKAGLEAVRPIFLKEIPRGIAPRQGQARPRGAAEPRPDVAARQPLSDWRE